MLETFKSDSRYDDWYLAFKERPGCHLQGEAPQQEFPIYKMEFPLWERFCIFLKNVGLEK